MSKVYGTIKRGKVKIKSKKQLRFLFAKKLSFTLYHKTKERKNRKETCEMTIQELSTKFDDVIKDLHGSPALGTIMGQIGSSAIIMIKDRVQGKGENAEGKQYPPYARTPMLANCSSMITSACTTIAGSKTKRRELKWVTLQRGGKNIRLFELPGGYKQYRELHGRQTGFVDFSVNNDMWNSINVIKDQTEQNAGIVRIGVIDGAKNSELQKNKLKGNTDRRGEILKLSRSEITELSGIFDTEIGKILVNHGLK